MRKDYRGRTNGLSSDRMIRKPMGFQQLKLCEDIEKELNELFQKYMEIIPKGRYLSKTLASIEDVYIWAFKAVEHDFQKFPEVTYVKTKNSEYREAEGREEQPSETDK